VPRNQPKRVNKFENKVKNTDNVSIKIVVIYFLILLIVMLSCHAYILIGVARGVQWVHLHLHPQLISLKIVEFFAVFCGEKYKLTAEPERVFSKLERTATAIRSMADDRVERLSSYCRLQLSNQCRTRSSWRASQLRTQHDGDFLHRVRRKDRQRERERERDRAVVAITAIFYDYALVSP